jgi:hypothetical protein
MLEFHTMYGEKCPNYDIKTSYDVCKSCKWKKSLNKTFSICNEKDKEGLKSVNALHPVLNGNLDISFNSAFLVRLTNEERQQYITRVRELIYQVLNNEMYSSAYIDGFNVYLPQN